MSDLRTNNTQFKDCTGKWVWILCELERKYGDEFFPEYVAAVRNSDSIKAISAHHKEVDGKRVHMTMDDIVHHMRIAAEDDLPPWFRELGISSK